MTRLDNTRQDNHEFLRDGTNQITPEIILTALQTLLTAIQNSLNPPAK